MTERSAWLLAGRVGKPHGLDGSFYVTEPKAQLLDAGGSLVVRGEPVEVTRRKGTERRPIIKLAGFEDREAVELIRGEELLAAREHAPALDEDEWWAEDLEGCIVLSGGRPIGVVRALVALPSCEALDVERAGDQSLLVPLVRDAVIAVDTEQRQIEIDLDFLGS